MYMHECVYIYIYIYWALPKHWKTIVHSEGCLGGVPFIKRNRLFEPGFWQSAKYTVYKKYTLPETNIALKMMVSNRNLLFQGSIFRGYVSFREGISSVDSLCL